MSRFITFEGPEGSGKSTQIQRLAERLRAAGWEVVVTREPGGTSIGNAIRSVVLGVAHSEMHPRTETLLFNAARAQIVEQVIRPALARGQIVLCDRYAESTLAYQGFGHRQPLPELRRLIDYATHGLRPHFIVYLDLDPAVGLARKRTDGEVEWNRLDAQTLSFHQRVRAGYRRLIEEEPSRWISIDANQAVDRVEHDVFAATSKRLPCGPPDHPEPQAAGESVTLKENT